MSLTDKLQELSKKNAILSSLEQENHDLDREAEKYYSDQER